MDTTKAAGPQQADASTRACEPLWEVGHSGDPLIRREPGEPVPVDEECLKPSAMRTFEISRDRVAHEEGFVCADIESSERSFEDLRVRFAPSDLDRRGDCRKYVSKAHAQDVARNKPGEIGVGHDSHSICLGERPNRGDNVGVEGHTSIPLANEGLDEPAAMVFGDTLRPKEVGDEPLQRVLDVRSVRFGFECRSVGFPPGQELGVVAAPTDVLKVPEGLAKPFAFNARAIVDERAEEVEEDGCDHRRYPAIARRNEPSRSHSVAVLLVRCAVVCWCSGALVYNLVMARLTITLSDRTHKELKVRAAMSGDSIGNLLEGAVADQRALARIESLRLVAKAHANAKQAPEISDDEVMDLAVRLTREVRDEMAAERAATGTN